MDTLDHLLSLQSDYIRLVEEEEPKHVEVLQEYLDLVNCYNCLDEFFD